MAKKVVIPSIPNEVPTPTTGRKKVAKKVAKKTGRKKAKATDTDDGGELIVAKPALDLANMTPLTAIETLSPDERRIYDKLNKLFETYRKNDLEWTYKVATICHTEREKALGASLNARGGKRKRMVPKAGAETLLQRLSIALQGTRAVNYLTDIAKVAVAWPTWEEFSAEVVEPVGVGDYRISTSQVRMLASLCRSPDEVDLRRKLIECAMQDTWTKSEMWGELRERRRILEGKPPRKTSIKTEAVITDAPTTVVAAANASGTGLPSPPAGAAATATKTPVDAQAGSPAVDDVQSPLPPAPEVKAVELPPRPAGKKGYSKDALNAWFSSLHELMCGICHTLPKFHNDEFSLFVALGEQPPEVWTRDAIDELKDTAGTITLARKQLVIAENAMTQLVQYARQVAGNAATDAATDAVPATSE